MLLTMLYAVYVDTVDEKRIVAIPAQTWPSGHCWRPQPLARARISCWYMTTKRTNAMVVWSLRSQASLLPIGQEAGAPCSWRRRGKASPYFALRLRVVLAA